MRKQSLNGKWKIENLETGISCMGEVPGSVIAALVEQGIVEEPYYRANEYKVREQMRNRYKFSKIFEVEELCFQAKEIELVCYGIDTLAEIFLNGHKLREVNNMHRTWRISCKKFLKKKNCIEVIFDSPIQYIEDYQGEEEKEIRFVSSGTMKGNQYLRKAHSMFGWDWGAQLPDIGIWRDIELLAYNDIRLGEIRIRQVHQESQVLVEVEVPIIGGKEDNEYKVSLSIVGEEYYSQVMLPVEEKVIYTFTIDNPHLWWPNGYGKQTLYKVKIGCITAEQEIIDEKDYSLGLRTLTISQKKDKWGKEFAFCVNGIKIFAKGANYIPEDCIYSRITKERIKFLVESAVKANFNCLRVWGGGYYPSDFFYDLCDRMGIIVWQDLMFACNMYELTEEFETNIKEEIYDNVIRLRHHACLGMWCGNNEIESAWENWRGFKEHSKRLRADYIKQFEYILPNAIRRKDDTTFYWPSSPSSGGAFDNPDSANRGDVHYWDVWHGQKPFSELRNHFFRFCSEFGFQSFPCKKTVDTFTEKQDWNIFSKVMESHQKNDSANGKILYYVSEQFLYPKDFESMLYVSQILQGLAVKTGVEHWRNHRGRCMGALYWQINDNWPAPSWSSIDYFGRWKALHYMAKKFYAPLNGTIERKGYQINVYLQNESLKNQSAEVTLTLKTFNFQEIQKRKLIMNVKELSSLRVLSCDYESLVKEREHKVFLECKVLFSEGYKVVQTELFTYYKYLQLQKPIYNLEVSGTKEKYLIKVKTNTFTPFLEIDFQGMDGILSDNYFDITGEEGNEVFIEGKNIWNEDCVGIQQLKEKIIIRSLYDTYNN